MRGKSSYKSIHVTPELVNQMGGYKLVININTIVLMTDTVMAVPMTSS